MDHGAEQYRRFLDGDRDAMTALIRDYKDGLTFFLCGFTGDLTAAEELAQETFVRLYVKRPRFSGRSRFRTWLYGEYLCCLSDCAHDFADEDGAGVYVMKENGGTVPVDTAVVIVFPDGDSYAMLREPSQD